MVAGKPAPQPTKSSTNETDPKSPTTTRTQTALKEKESSTLDGDPDSMIMIKRTYNFAGKIYTEQKLVPHSSAEAKLFLASQTTSTPQETSTETPHSSTSKPKRPLKRARKSVFEPLTEIPLRTDLHFGPRKESEVALTDVGKGAKKLNTVDKSAMDWARFVDTEGIKDDLDKAGKSKGAYRERQEFLARVEEKKVGDERRDRGLPV